MKKHHFLLVIVFLISSCTINHTPETDYKLYLDKVWIVKDWDLETYRFPPSIRISKTENNTIEGVFSTGRDFYALPPCYIYSFDTRVGFDFIGTIKNDVALCYFDDESEIVGTIELKFLQNDKIEVSFNFERYFYNNEFPNGTYIFEPYNLSDLGDNLKNLNSFTTNLDSWGTINFATAVIDNGHKPYPTAYLTDANGDILYQFGAYQVGSEVTDVLIEDVNEDGLKDVKITTNFDIVWLFMQMENGLFYDSRLSDDACILGEYVQP